MCAPEFNTLMGSSTIDGCAELSHTKQRLSSIMSKELAQINAKEEAPKIRAYII